MILEVVRYECPVHALSRLHEIREVGRLVNVWASYSQLELSSNAKKWSGFCLTSRRVVPAALGHERFENVLQPQFGGVRTFAIASPDAVGGGTFYSLLCTRTKQLDWVVETWSFITIHKSHIGCHERLGNDQCQTKQETTGKSELGITRVCVSSWILLAISLRLQVCKVSISTLHVTGLPFPLTQSQRILQLIRSHL